MDINIFKFCSGLRVLGYLMVLLVAAIIAVSYYAVVVVTCGSQLLQGGGGHHSFFAILLIVVFHVLLALLTWSYVMVVFWDPGSVPENWRPVLSSEECLEAGSSSITTSDTVGSEGLDSTLSISEGLDRRQQVGYCDKCRNGKPPRCHHCSVCQRCVLKMDHHCVWVVNCVGARNYKFFLLFLVHEKKRAVRWKYDIGRKKNFEQVFGTKKVLWFFPLFSKEDLDNIPALNGIEFPIRSDV